MRELFSWRLPLSEDDFSELWDNAIFVFDTNFLLDIYRSSISRRKDIFKILEKLKEEDRIWLPYQVANEFLNNREKTIKTEKDSFKKAKDELTKWKNERKELKSLKKIFENNKRIISSEIESLFDEKEVHYAEYIQGVEEIEQVFLDQINNLEENYSDLDSKNDGILEQILDLFDDSKVGNPYNKETLQEKYKEAETRYQESIPPGFKDANKEKEEEKYGDVMIWFQILDFAKEKSKPIIFVTRDNKVDWWIKENGKSITPHMELRHEFKEIVKQKFWMYQTKDFLKEAENRLNLEIDDKSIEETDDIAEIELSMKNSLSNLSQKLIEEKSYIPLKEKKNDIISVFFKIERDRSKKIKN